MSLQRTTTKKTKCVLQDKSEKNGDVSKEAYEREARIEHMRAKAEVRVEYLKAKANYYSRKKNIRNIYKVIFYCDEETVFFFCSLQLQQN